MRPRRNPKTSNSCYNIFQSLLLQKHLILKTSSQDVTLARITLSPFRGKVFFHKMYTIFLNRGLPAHPRDRVPGISVERRWIPMVLVQCKCINTHFSSALEVAFLLPTVSYAKLACFHVRLWIHILESTTVENNYGPQKLSPTCIVGLDSVLHVTHPIVCQRLMLNIPMNVGLQSNDHLIYSLWIHHSIHRLRNEAIRRLFGSSHCPPTRL